MACGVALAAVATATLATSTPNLANAAPSNGAFCKGYLAMNTSIGDFDNGGDLVAVAKKMRAAAKTAGPAPAEVATPWAAITTAVDTAASGKPEALYDDVLIPPLAAVGVYVANSCGYRNIVVTTRENSFSGVPKTIKPGVVSFKNVKRGKDAHVIHIARRRTGVTTSMSDVIKGGKGRDSSRQGGIRSVLQDVRRTQRPGPNAALSARAHASEVVELSLNHSQSRQPCVVEDSVGDAPLAHYAHA